MGDLPLKTWSSSGQALFVKQRTRNPPLGASPRDVARKGFAILFAREEGAACAEAGFPTWPDAKKT